MEHRTNSRLSIRTARECCQPGVLQKVLLCVDSCVGIHLAHINPFTHLFPCNTGTTSSTFSWALEEYFLWKLGLHITTFFTIVQFINTFQPSLFCIHSLKLSSCVNHNISLEKTLVVVKCPVAACLLCTGWNTLFRDWLCLGSLGT